MAVVHRLAEKGRTTKGKGTALVIEKIPKSFEKFLKLVEDGSSTLFKGPCGNCTAMFKHGLVLQEEIFPSGKSSFVQYCRDKMNYSYSSEVLDHSDIADQPNHPGPEQPWKE